MGISLPKAIAPKDMGGYSINNVLSLGGSAQSSPPGSPSDGDMYLDDGTNTLNGQPGWRVYVDGSWFDLGYQPQIVGVEWNQSTDTWARIDKDGYSIALVRSNFDFFWPWASIRRVNLSDAGEINAVYGNDNYTEDGSNGRVMVQIPKFWVKSEKIIESGETKYRWWIADHEAAGFEVHPAFNQRAVSPPAPFIYIAAYGGDFSYDSANAHYELHSREGVQPWTGGQIWAVDFDGGQNEPAIGNEVSTPNGSGWFIVDYVVTSGSWAGNDAAGKLWVRKPGDDSLGWVDNDTITNDTQSNTLGTCEFAVGAKTALHLDIEEARTYAENIGTNWGLFNIWSLAAIQLLLMIEYGNMDSQSNIGQGIVNKAGGTGFNGELTGADNINSQLGPNGTGSGTGTDGLTPIAYRWLENFWGNAWIFIDGYEAVDAAYRILRRDGGWTNPGPTAWGASDYEESAAAPITSDGYISDIVYEALLKYLLISAAVAGSSSTYIPDHFWAHDTAENNILLAGGPWNYGSRAGVGYLNSNHDVGYSYRSITARAEFIG